MWDKLLFALGWVLALIFAVIAFFSKPLATPPEKVMGVIVGLVLIIFIGILGAILLWKMAKGEIDLNKLVSEPTGGASLSRFQFLIFTFVISMSLFLVIIGHANAPEFPTTIPPEIFALLGISGGSYLISKGISKSGKQDDQSPPTDKQSSPTDKKDEAQG